MSRSKRRTLAKILKIVLIGGSIVLIFYLSAINLDNGRKLDFFPKDIKNLKDDVESINSKRLSTIRRVCKKYNLGIYRESDRDSAIKHPPAPQYTVFYINQAYNVSYCPIYKAGTTTWLYNLCLLSNVSEEELNSGREQISTIARRVMPELEYPEADVALRRTKRLLVVRHPFERLLSAYRDKLENSIAGREHGTLHFYQKYGAKIVRKYRGKHFSKPSPRQVIQRKDAPPPAGVEPTWREFVEYLIDTDLASYGDDHWLPYYLYCTPCLINYDIVSTVESLSRDQIYAIKNLGLGEKIKPSWRHKGGHLNASKIYFSQLNRNLVRKLYEKYQLDFELFDYSPDDYYSYATASD